MANWQHQQDDDCQQLTQQHKLEEAGDVASGGRAD